MQEHISSKNKEQLCMDLLRADSEEQVIEILSDSGLWNNLDNWRYFGDREDNFSTIGNQSSSADGALVEKIVNSVDAVLIGECWLAGIQPNSQKAPNTIPNAVAKFLFADNSANSRMGYICNWTPEIRRAHSDRITLSVTGRKDQPSITIVDTGEGQTPESIPDTLLSLDRQNKVDIHFVQGKFNMGGTGALRFCGNHNLQLIISRRNPDIVKENTKDKFIGHWGFTIVRREPPKGKRRNSTYTYLAPGNTHQNPRRGEVLSFSSECLQIMPFRNKPYARNVQWGTAVKLYEYKLRGYTSNILLRDGLLNRLDRLLPRIALPIRLHECRNYKGKESSFDTTLTGLSVRLSDDSSEILEPDFPWSSSLSILGEEMSIEVYAFKKSKGDKTRKEGVIFTVNGQSHGNLPKRFFGRKSVGMQRIEDSILVIVDCSQISGRAREDLFMNSRDRMEQGEFLKRIERELESVIYESPLLRDLRNKRREDDLKNKLEDSKPFQEVLESILKKSPSLSSLFSGKGPLPNPFKPFKTKDLTTFRGRSYPSYFRFKQMPYGKDLLRTTPANMRSRISFETDVTNDYFTREPYGGKFRLQSLNNGLPNEPLPSNSLNLQNGTATLNLALPEGAKVGETFRYRAEVSDDTLAKPFENYFLVTVKPAQKPRGGRTDRPGVEGNENGGKNSRLEGLQMPDSILVYEADWSDYGFDRLSALKAVHDPPKDDENSGRHMYYLNMDNLYLKTELKNTKEHPEILKARWKYGMVLIGMALLRERKEPDNEPDDGFRTGGEAASPYDCVYEATAAIAPVLLPLIAHLGSLSESEFKQVD